MFFEYELERHRQSLTKDFDADEISAITGQAIVDLKTRNIAGVVIVPIAYLVGGFATDYASEQSYLYFSLAAFLAVAILFRVLAIIAFSRDAFTKNHIWIPVFFWSNISVAIVWAWFASSAILYYHDSLSITLIIILLAGISGGSMASYCIWKLLSFAYLLIILLPPIITEFYVGNSVTIPIGVAISAFLIFNLVQANLWNKQFWLSLINTFMIEKNALELEKLNTQLTDEIAERKQIAQNIAISRKKLQDIYNSAHDGIFIFELNGQVIDINDTMLSMFHVTRQDALKYDINRSFQSTNNKDVDLQSIWQKVLNGNDQEFKWLTRVPGKDALSTVQVNLRKSVWGDDSIIIATVRDITLQVEAMETTIAANRAKSEFLANISHELRTPMHGILGYARLGIKRSEILPREKLYEYFSIIQESGTRLMGLLNNVLDFSKLEVGKMQYDIRKNDLLPRIHQVVTELTPSAAEKGLIFKIECPTQQIEVFCDQEKIVQVLRNLLFNAIKFSNEKSTIQIICKEFSGDADGIKQQISISNIGVSIPVAELDAIFDQFIQSSVTNTGAGGTGLGLAISKQILQDHNSIIWAENLPNGETLFCFLLPVTEDQVRRINKE
jgi:PAS domain S-box-containing protein